jgi:hypothetical protein
MKRRTIFKSLVGAAALAPSALAQTAPAPDDALKLEFTTAEAVADPGYKFFSPQQYATLVRLCELLGPAYNGKPSAKQAGTPEFLDFLLAQSPADRQVLYGQGLGQLDIDARLRRGKAFSDLSDAEAGELLAPLRGKWTWKTPADPLARFLREAKTDVLRATVNSKAYADAGGGSRRTTGVNAYWDVIE